MSNIIDIKSVTLEKLIDEGSLWVVDKLPVSDSKTLQIIQAEAKPKGNIDDLIKKWLVDGFTSVAPRVATERDEQFKMMMKFADKKLVLVVFNAELLHRRTFDNIRQLLDYSCSVVLVGDVSAIDVATRPYPSFVHRSRLGINPSKL